MIEIIKSNPNINFMGKAKYAFGLSVVIIIATAVLWFQRGEARYGVDFKGGLEMIIKAESGTGSDDIRKTLESAGIGNAVVQSFEVLSHEFAIRIGGGNIDTKKVIGDITKALETKKTEVLATNYIGPTVGSELRRQAFVAIIVSLLGIMLYVAFRFEFAFGLGALVAVLHDVVVCVGFYLLMGYEFNMSTVAALLTVAGYSVNDTIVIFDRVREEVFKRKEFELWTLMNECVNATLARTIITGGLTLMSAIALLTLGGGSIRDLSLTLVVGLISGCYSTIYIASPIAYYWEEYRSRRAEA